MIYLVHFIAFHFLTDSVTISIVPHLADKYYLFDHLYSCTVIPPKSTDFLSHHLEWEILVLLNRLIFILWPDVHDLDLSYKPVICQGSLSTDCISHCYQNKFRIHLKITTNHLTSSTNKVSQHLLSLSPISLLPDYFLSFSCLDLCYNQKYVISDSNYNTNSSMLARLLNSHILNVCIDDKVARSEIITINILPFFSPKTVL